VKQERDAGGNLHPFLMRSDKALGTASGALRKHGLGQKNSEFMAGKWGGGGGVGVGGGGGGGGKKIAFACSTFSKGRTIFTSYSTTVLLSCERARGGEETKHRLPS